ncbi:hypothetical protein Anas_14072 [Armadillidium nasatum]|uniref:Uncharacterized protein n=1 Tax=Armadillidium nasatum TaxID=96803 RepID=A0A5N5T8V2_9CRUS|nr:hypothetical protein Anas_14072 [Armadillidium nasatum]
MMKDKLIIGK